MSNFPISPSCKVLAGRRRGEFFLAEELCASCVAASHGGEIRRSCVCCKAGAERSSKGRRRRKRILVRSHKKPLKKTVYFFFPLRLPARLPPFARLKSILPNPPACLSSPARVWPARLRKETKEGRRVSQIWQKRDLASLFQVREGKTAETERVADWRPDIGLYAEGREGGVGGKGTGKYRGAIRGRTLQSSLFPPLFSSACVYSWK